MLVPASAAADFGPVEPILPGYGGFPAAATGDAGHAAVVATGTQVNGVGLAIRTAGAGVFGSAEVVSSEASR